MKNEPEIKNSTLVESDGQERSEQAGQENQIERMEKEINEFKEKRSILFDKYQEKVLENDDLKSKLTLSEKKRQQFETPDRGSGKGEARSPSE